ncbi:helix-turn-helix transcriptional regulator [Kribbella deserti]|uniref:Helix-turn-helix transcriptional regulator n=1 Tax=Kribbella deserti TaxID=1926257 RepID=A0ABV6QCZ3_9ACTN
MSETKNSDRAREPLWGVEEVSIYLGVPVRTLYQWRTKNYGPPGERIGRHLRYKATDVVAWFDGLADRS